MQAVNHVQAVVEGIELLAPGIVGEQFAQRPLQRGQALAAELGAPSAALDQAWTAGLRAEHLRRSTRHAAALNRAEAGRILTNAKPPVDEDVVYVHVAAEGKTGGHLRRKEFVRSYYPIEIGGKSRTAIAWTTSASVVAVIEMVKAGALPR